MPRAQSDADRRRVVHAARVGVYAVLIGQSLVALISRPTLPSVIVTLSLLAIGGIALRTYSRYAARDARALHRQLRRAARRKHA
jgi:hypothetical protein